MRFKVPILVFCFAGLLCFAGQAQAGALRLAGKGIVKGSEDVASATADGAGAAASGVAAVTTDTGGALKSGAAAAASGVAAATTNTGGVLKSGAAAMGKGAAATPRVAWDGTKTAARGIFKVLW